ncbi:MAG: hypothetical protein M0R46_09040 [Candidatus Muirbacterium halophilum]|nr:hypothetical protein [Candidatus Muirbacterium halophilum]MCK9476051.1 hypothetical protein [Candidatus Muirbacterium halophilum]
MKKDIVLLPSQSKRLIAKAILQSEYFTKRFSENSIYIAKGSTNSYIIEEFLGKKFEKKKFTTGVVLPNDKTWIDNEKLPEYVIDKGKIETKDSIDEIVNELDCNDIIVKGANAINYAKSTAGIFIGHPQAGTISKIFQAYFGRRVKLIIPVGLEKEVSFDLDEVSEMMSESDCTPETPRLFSIRTEIFTEIEAISTLTSGKVRAYHIGTGGINGAQGAVRLLLDGPNEEVLNIVKLKERLPEKDEFSE